MAKIDCLLLRSDFGDEFTLGTFCFAGKFLGYTCEDRDRHVEAGGTKIPGKTAIPRGYYRLTVSMSKRFGRLMPEIVGVPAADTADVGNDRFAPVGSKCLDAWPLPLSHIVVVFEFPPLIDDG